jgi:signal transduction histidine kinase
MIQNLLQMYRLESGTQVLEICELDVENLIESCISSIQPIADSRSVSVKVSMQFEGQAWADQMALTRVLQNLLDNALKYTPAGGIVEVSVRRVHDRLVLSVKDSGPGINSTTASKLFQRFWQGDTRRTTIAGSGIGLYLCKQIVDAHGGTITFETKPDEGTVFIVSIPTSQPATAMLARS